MFRNTASSMTLNPEAEAALKAAREVGPHAYKLSGLSPGEDLCYIEIGCGGDNSPSQDEVARLIDAKVKKFNKADRKIHFMILLGDNIYPAGASSPYDEKFKQYIEDKYHLKKFAIAGNHDCGIHIFSNRYDKDPRDVLLNARAHTFTPEGEKFPTTESKQQFFQEKKPVVTEKKEEDLGFVIIENDENYHVPRTTLDINALPDNCNMPCHCFSLYTDKEEIFFVDSNTLAEDFINWIDKNQTLRKDNQIPFLIEEYKDAIKNKRTICFKMHQLPKTTGERYFISDTHNYYYPEKIKRLQEILETTSDFHNDFINFIFKYIGINITHASGAHDHFMEIRDEGNYLQIVSGGGGSKERQQIQTNLFHPAIKFNVDHHGFTMHCGPLVYMFTTKGLEVIYDKNKHDFIYPKCPIYLLRMCILQACDNYIAFLKEKEEKELKPKNNHTQNGHSWMTSFGLFCEKTWTFGSKGINKLSKKFAGYDFKHHRNQEIASVYEMMAAFSQVTLDDEKIMTYFTLWKKDYEKTFFYTALKEHLKHNLNAVNCHVDFPKALATQILAVINPDTPNQNDAVDVQKPLMANCNV
jgi:Calcineurin-like phosphoesterase